MNTNYLDLPIIRYQTKLPNGLISSKLSTTEAQLVVYEAEKLNISWELVPFTEMIKFSYKGHTEYFLGRFQTTMGIIGYRICYDKSVTRSVLEEKNLPIAKGFTINSSDSLEVWESVFNALQKPLAIKQTSGSHGDGIFLNIETLADFKTKVATIFSDFELSDDGKALVEEMIQGKEYRIIATNEKVVAVMFRQPASVIGDGTLTIQELITEKNKEPIRNLSQKLYPHIPINEEVIQTLKKQHMELSTVPTVNQVIQLRFHSNIMAGGDAYDVTDDIHPSVAEIAIKTVQSIPGLPFSGIDFMTTDITKDQAFEQHAIIEVNANPEFDMHDIPMHGKTRGVTKEFLFLLFPELRENKPKALKNRQKTDLIPTNNFSAITAV